MKTLSKKLSGKLIGKTTKTNHVNLLKKHMKVQKISTKNRQQFYHNREYFTINIPFFLLLFDAKVKLHQGQGPDPLWIHYMHSYLALPRD